MTYWIAILLGFVQGVAEFLPISSSGHLSALQTFFRIGATEEHLFFDVLLHFGTLCAVFLAYFDEIRDLWREGLAMLHIRALPAGARPNLPRRRMLLFLIAATVPLVLAAVFHNTVEALYENTFFIGFALLLTGGILFAADRMSHGNKKERSMTLSDALLIGLAQTVAVVPGFSRSGATISTGMLRGLDRSFAVKFSFLLSIPAVLGANLLTLIKAIRAGIDWGMMPIYLAGVASAFVFGYLSIYVLRRIVQKGKFGGFAYYCWGAGLVTLLLSLIS